MKSLVQHLMRALRKVRETSDRKKVRQYLEVELEEGGALRFDGVSESLRSAICDRMNRLPVRPFETDPAHVDSWGSVDTTGTAREIADRMLDVLRKDRERVQEELHDVAESDIYITEMEYRPDVLHIVTRLIPVEGAGSSVSYGARVQRVEVERYLLWSDY